MYVRLYAHDPWAYPQGCRHTYVIHELILPYTCTCTYVVLGLIHVAYVIRKHEVPFVPKWCWLNMLCVVWCVCTCPPDVSFECIVMNIILICRLCNFLPFTNTPLSVISSAQISSSFLLSIPVTTGPSDRTGRPFPHVNFFQLVATTPPALSRLPQFQ